MFTLVSVAGVQTQVAERIMYLLELFSAAKPLFTFDLEAHLFLFSLCTATAVFTWGAGREGERLSLQKKIAAQLRLAGAALLGLTIFVSLASVSWLIGALFGLLFTLRLGMPALRELRRL